jgi:hypothetical protein
MNDLERFKAVASFAEPDYVPIFGFPGAPGMSRGCMKPTHDQLVASGMPAWVGGCYEGGVFHDVESWYRYWGTTGCILPDFTIGRGAEGFRRTVRIEGEFEVIESENGAITRQVLNNDITYSMPEFVRYPVRDRASWEFYRERTTPRQVMAADELERRCRVLDKRTMPLCLSCGSTYGRVRGLLGTEGVSLALYDDPGLVHDIIARELRNAREFIFPLIERLRPEIVGCGEDLCYNHGMLLSPSHFEEFCAPFYREVSACARAHGAVITAVDTDGNAMEFTGIARACGVNAIYPYEVKSGNDLFKLRESYPDFVLFGWLEKEVVNEGNEALIEPEISAKVPALLKHGGYFPNGDHGIQPMITFPNLCRFMTLLHEACGNPEGEFPRG